MQVQKMVEVLTGKLATATENWNALWKSFRLVADLLRTPTDDGQSWALFIRKVPTRFQEFMKRCAQLCTRNVLAQVWVLALEMPLSKIVEEADLARRIVDNLNINISSPDNDA